jgi:hypothetical protein
VYRFQLRVAVEHGEGGLNALRLRLTFENGIMSLPRIFAGRNRIHFRLRESDEIREPVLVTYRYRTAAGEKAHEQAIEPSDMRKGRASYVIDAPGLLRCNSLSVSYGYKN